jgi:hypothetical protein
MKIKRAHLVLFIAAFLSAAAHHANAGVQWCTFLGGPGAPMGIALDREGNVYVAGYTSWADFLTSPPEAYDRTFNGSFDIFVAKLNPTGSSLLYSTFIGGSDEDFARAIAVDSEGNAYVTGGTKSPDFPITTGALQTTHGVHPGIDYCDVFVTALNSSGTEIIYSTFLGGGGDENGRGIAIDDEGNAYVAGGTTSSEFPTTPGAYDEYHSGLSDGFVAKLNATGSALVYSTFLNGWGITYCTGIAIDSQRAVYVTGSTEASDFPVTPHAFDTTYNGGPGGGHGGDAFITKFNPSGSNLVYSTFLGGEEWDGATAIGLDNHSNVYVTGYTYSLHFPTTLGAIVRPYDAHYGGPSAFVTKFNALGTTLEYSSIILYDGYDYALAVDADGNACIGIADMAGLLELNGSGSQLLFSIVLGDPQNTYINAVVVDDAGDIYIAGATGDPHFPVTPGAFDTTSIGTFVAKLRPDPITASSLWPLYE